MRYNRCHDQLLLSGGTDSLVNLWRVSSISSAPLLEMEDPSRCASWEEGTRAPGGGGGGDPSLRIQLIHASHALCSTITYARSTDSPDLRVKALEEHEESVYAVAWSAADPFLFASASYDGRVVVNAVPPSEKYKILL